MCQVHTGACVSLRAPGKTDYTACHREKTRTTYILHVVSITTHTHDRRKSIGKKKQRKEKIEKIKEKKKQESEKTEEERRGKKRQEKRSKERK